MLKKCGLKSWPIATCKKRGIRLVCPLVYLVLNVLDIYKQIDKPVDKTSYTFL